MTTVGLVTIGAVVLLPADASAFDGGLIAAYTAFFLYGVIGLIDPDIPLFSLLSGGAVLIVGIGTTSVGLAGGGVSVGLFGRASSCPGRHS